MIQSSPVPSPVHRFKRAKFWKQVAIGAIVGGVSMGLALASIDGLKGATLTPDEAVALGAGVIYSIIGLFVGLGALFPKAGSELLNVEDEEEIRDQRHIFGWGAVAMLLSGLLMLGLVLGSPGFEFLGRAVAAALVAACVAGIACVGYITRNDSDEFGKRLRAFVVLSEPVDEDVLKAHVKDNLARYKVPREIVVLDELPRNATGKVLKRELADHGSEDES